MCHNFGSPDTNPIPADFFDLGSDPSTSTVCLRGVPLGIPQFGNADTLISRSADPFDRCDLPSGTSSTVNIEIVSLSLESVDPITVTHNGGQNPELWKVTVDLSPGGLPPSTPPRTLTAIKSHCNGGMYTSVLYVQPRFTFTKISNPSEVRVLDTGIVGTPPVELVQSDPHPWVSDIDPFLGAMVDFCSDFHANIAQNNPLLECNCNGNTRRDLCDIEQGTSQDCNANARPDECDISSASSQDVNLDGIPDECQIPESLGIGNDDKCIGGANAGLACAEHADCPGGVCRVKNRFITAVIPATATSHGIKVSLVGIDGNSVADPTNYNGTDRWVGAPSLNVSDGISPSFNAGKLQCVFASQDWSAIGQIQLYGDVVVPGSTYDVSVCLAEVGPCSVALRIGTARFGDVIVPTPAVNFQDVQSIVAKFQGAPTGPSKTRSDLVGAVLLPNNPINFQDVSANVSAFQSKAFKTVVTTPPATCP